MQTTVPAAVLAALLWLPAAPLRPPVGGPVEAPFDATGPYSAGHRGIDLDAVPGTAVHAPAAGTVVFAGTVVGNLTVTIDTGGGRLVHLSYLDAVAVAVGAKVATGTVVGRSGRGHDGGGNVHLGIEIDGVYVDPLPLLARRRAVLTR